MSSPNLARPRRVVGREHSNRHCNCNVRVVVAHRRVEDLVASRRRLDLECLKFAHDAITQGEVMRDDEIACEVGDR